MLPLFQHLLCNRSLFCLLFSLNLDEILLLSSGNSILSPYVFTADLFLKYCDELPDICHSFLLHYYYINVQTYYYINVNSIIFLCIAYFTCATNEWSAVLNINFFSMLFGAAASVWDCYGFFNKYASL